MSTTRIERRGLESERRTGISLRIEFEGAEDAEVVRLSEAFLGRNSEEVVGEEVEACCASFRAFCRLRCGRSGAEAGVGGVGRDSGASAAPIDVESATVDVKAPLLPLAKAFSSKTLGEKYPAHGRGMVPATAALAFEALENFLLPNRIGSLIVCRRQDRQTVLRRGDLKALAGRCRIIIACCCWVHKNRKKQDVGSFFEVLV